MEDQPVFVVDLRPSRESAPPRDPPDAPLDGNEAVASVAVIDTDGEIVLLPIEPTTDRRYLDAVARLLRFAVERGEPVRAVLRSFGGSYERGLAEAGRLPAWMFAAPAALGTRGSPGLRRALSAG